MQGKDDEYDPVDIGNRLNNIGIRYENENKKKIALAYYQRALVIYERFLPDEHLSRNLTKRNIRRVTEDK
jgi:hypothetical protein